MNIGLRQKTERIFQAVVELPEDEWEVFLEEQCGTDGALRREVDKLLGASESVMGGFMQAPAYSTPGSSGDLDGAIPESIGQYRVVRRLGEGGMGIVYEARQEKTGSVVALKVIRAAGASRETIKRFEHEASVLGRLRHPGIAQVHEAGIHSSGGAAIPFIAMELIEGHSLLEYIRLESPDLPAILNLFAMICEAVNHAHQRGVIHRDLKPSNILIKQADGPVQPKILDFGIARVTDADTHATTLRTHTGQLIGTVKYMSPEQAAGDPAQIDTRSDVYSLGVILYESLARRMPYAVEGTLLHEAVRTIREDEARPISAIDSTYRGDITAILCKALEKDKSRRYQSAHELAADLRRHLNNEPIIAHPPSAMYQLRKLARRNRGLVAGAVIVVLLLVGGIVATSRQAAEATRARLAEQAQRERAERRYNDVRSLARTLIFDVDARITPLAGSTPARELIVTKGLEYLNRVAEDADPGDAVLQHELGTAYFKLGDVQGDPAAPNLGDPEGALENYLKGLKLMQTGAAPESKQEDTAQDIAMAHNRIGHLLESMGRREEARQRYERARRILADLHRAFPADIVVSRELANSYDLQAEAHKEAGRFEEAIQAELEALKLLKSVLQVEPQHALTRHSVAAINSQFGEILEMQGRHDEALTRRSEALRILESLSKDEPFNTIYRRNLGVAADRLGLSYKAAGRLEEALSSFERAVDIAEQFRATEPDYEHIETELHRAYTHLGEVQLTMGSLGDAVGTFRELLNLSRRRLSRNETSAEAQRQLGVAFYKMAESELAHGNNPNLPDGSRIEHFQKARGWFGECRTVFIRMRDSGVLGISDSGVPAAIASDIAACDGKIAQLNDDGAD